jgi:hypothetical protein
LVTAYGTAMEKIVGSTIEVTWKKNNNRTVDTNVILVPVAYDGHFFALHFLSITGDINQVIITTLDRLARDTMLSLWLMKEIKTLGAELVSI